MFSCFMIQTVHEQKMTNRGAFRRIRKHSLRVGTHQWSAIRNTREPEPNLNQHEMPLVCSRFAVTQSQSSGTCISFINGQQRSLVAHIGAANTYAIDDLLKNKDVFDEVSIVYFEGFFLTHSFEVAREIVAQCQIRGILLVFNISAVYVVEQYQEEVRLLAGAANVIIGNRLEVEELVKVLNLDNPVQLDSPRLLQRMPFHGKTADQLKLKGLQFTKDERLVVVTDGKNTVVCVDGAGRTEHAVTAMDACYVRDTTGAGDAFTAGFLFGIVRGRNVDTSLEMGVWAAQVIIRQVGCTLPSVVPKMPCSLWHEFYN